LNAKITKLLTDLNDQLSFIDLEIDNQLTLCESAINVILKTLQGLKKTIYKRGFKSQGEEIYFFKEIKPQFTSKLIYYNTLFKIEMKRPNGGNRILRKYYNKELSKLKAFFDNELEFYKYYRSGSSYLDYKYFMRGKFDIKISLDSRYFESDIKFSTSHDYKVAKILANDLLQLYLENQLITIENKDNNSNNNKSQVNPKVRQTWTSSKVALIKLLYALHSQGVFNNGASDLKDIASYLENVFDIDLGQYHRAFLEIRIRKTDRTKFLTALKKNLTKKMDDTDESINN
jgi:hypothetical protein